MKSRSKCLDRSHTISIWKCHAQEAGEGSRRLGVPVLRDAGRQHEKRKATFVGTTNQYKNKSDARVAVEALLLKLNEEKPQHHLGAVTFGAICDRYIEEELPERYSTRKSYLSNIKLHIRPRWERYLLHQIRPMVVEGWLKNMDMAPKSKAHIRSVMHLMFECAARWELFNDRRNPMQIVRVKDGSKRRQRQPF